MDLHPEWIAGFVDGEGCFHISINTNAEMAVGYQVLPEFTVTQHERSIQVLHALKKFFGNGVIRPNRKKGTQRMVYRVRDRKILLNVIVPFFFSHELKTAKKNDFLLFRKVLFMMEKGDHLTHEGLQNIRDLVKTET